MTKSAIALTPFQLSVLIHCYISTTKHSNYNSVRGCLEGFLKQDVIQHYKGESEIFITTSKGEAWLRAMLYTPIPTSAWVDSYGEVIPDE